MLLLILGLILSLVIPFLLPGQATIAQDTSNSTPTNDLRKSFIQARNLAERSEGNQDVEKAQILLKELLSTYEKKDSNTTIGSLFARLNQMSLLLDTKEWLEDWLNEFDRSSPANEPPTKAREWNQSIQKEIDSLNLEGIKENLKKLARSNVSGDGLQFSRNLNFARISFAQNLTKLSKDSLKELDPFYWTYIDQLYADALREASKFDDNYTRSYAQGYWGGLYETLSKLKKTNISLNLNKNDCTSLLLCAQKLTEEALQTSKALPEHESPYLSYKWEWQLGRINRLQEHPKAAIANFDEAVKTSKEIRSKLLAANPDTQFSFRDEAEPLYRQYIDLLLSLNQSSVSQFNIRKAREVVEELRVAEVENFLGCAFGSSRTVEDVVGNDSTVAVVYPIILKNRIEVVLSLSGKPLQHFPSSSISNKHVETTIRQLRYSLEQPYFSSIRGRTAASQVYDWLIRPVEPSLESHNIKTLLFVLDKSLRNIPMAALYDEKKQEFLIQKYALSLFPRLQFSDTVPHKKLKALLIGLSDDPKVEDLSRLNFVSDELQKIEKTLNGSNQKHQFKKLEATSKDEVKKQTSSPEYNLIHLATHAEFNFDRDKTYILIAPGETSKIKLDDLPKLFGDRQRNPLELLVLSACETATGDDRDLLGLAGIAVQSGARSTLATLWSVEDSSTAILMQKFYSMWLNNKTEKITKAEALRRAQSELLNAPDSKYKPAQWAPYVLVGDWR
jgi:CHAT domain-containing protein